MGYPRQDYRELRSGLIFTRYMNQGTDGRGGVYLKLRSSPASGEDRRVMLIDLNNPRKWEELNQDGSDNRIDTRP